jgi:hypothetical protein
MFGPEQVNVVWRTGPDEELYRLYQHADVVTHMRISILQWARRLSRMFDDENQKGILERCLEEEACW